MRYVGAAVIGFLVAVCSASTALAQKTTGDMTGTIMDGTGAVLPGVTVNAVCTTTNATRTAVSDAQGGFSIPELAVCVYKVSAELPGFKTVSREVQIAVHSVSKDDLRLEVGAQSESITVEGVSPLVDLSDNLNNYVDKDRIDSVPPSGRDLSSLLGG